MIIEDKKRKKALRIGCLMLILSALMFLLAAYGAVQLVYNYLIIPNL